MESQRFISSVTKLLCNRNWLVPTNRVVMLFVASAMLYCIQKTLQLPILPLTTLDSESYIWLPELRPPEYQGCYFWFADHRPPGYPVFLYIHCAIFGGLSYLPQVQFGLFFTSVVLLALSVASLTQNILGAFVIVGFSAYSPEFYPALIMSDCLYASLVATGAACFIFSLSTKRPSLVWSAALFYTLAATTRTIGFVIIPALAISLAVLIISREQRARTVLLAGVPIGIVLVGACAITYRQTGHFRIGEFGGMSLLGKGLMIATPLPPNHPFSSLNWIPEETKPAQLELRRAPSVRFKMLELQQYYEYLRWDKMLVEFDRRWPSWSHTRSGYDQGRLALELSKQYIANNPMGYTQLVLLDYLALWSVPRLLTKSEQVFLQQTWASMDVAFLTSFEKTGRRKEDYFKVVPQAYGSDAQVWMVRTVSLAFGLASVLVPIMLLVHRGRFESSVVASLVLLGLSVHFSYVATAVVEAGLVRYIFPTWPLMVAALTLLPNLMVPCSRDTIRA